jgi:eukaryotic-like serine/threonine-protein kinase
MGTVYRARDPLLDRHVALKTIAPGLLSSQESLERFQREARAAARLQHPNIVTIYELGEADGRHYIAMELLEGMDLAQAMTPGDRLPLSEKLRIVVDVCQGLDFAHKRGVFHRDVKPANVRVLPDLSVKLVDFGIARLEDSTMTQTGLVLGTPSYIAPEVLTGSRVDHRADLWAVGVLLYELLSGERPFEAPTIAGLVYRIVHQPPRPIAAAALGLPPAIPALIERALAKDPAGRFRDLAEMAGALQELLGVGKPDTVRLPPAVREASYQRNLAEAQKHFADGEWERALEVARRALALEPGRTEVLTLLRQIEDGLREAPTLIPRRAKPPTEAPPRTEHMGVTAAVPAAPLGTSVTTSVAEPRPSTSQILTELRLRGASVFRELATFGEPPGSQTARVSPTGDVLAVSSADGALRLWDLIARTRVATLRTELHQRTGHDALATCLTYSEDGRFLASGHVDGKVHLWDVARAVEIPAKLRHEAIVSALAFSPDAQFLASGGLDSNLKIWNIPATLAGEARRELYRQPTGVTGVCWASAGKLIITAHGNRVLRLQDSATGRLLASLRGPEASINLLAMHPDGKRLAVASQDRTLRFFDLAARTQVLQLTLPHRKPLAGLCFFPGGEHLATVAQDNAVQLWDLSASAPLAALWGEKGDAFVGVALFREGDHLAVALADGRIRLWGPAA